MDPLCEPWGHQGQRLTDIYEMSHLIYRVVEWHLCWILMVNTNICVLCAHSHRFSPMPLPYTQGLRSSPLLLPDSKPNYSPLPMSPCKLPQATSPSIQMNEQGHCSQPCPLKGFPSPQSLTLLLSGAAVHFSPCPQIQALLPVWWGTPQPHPIKPW